MQKKYLIRAALIMLLITGSYLILWSTSPASSPDTCCENMEECIQKKDKPDPAGEMIWENFSRQFFSFSGANN